MPVRQTKYKTVKEQNPNLATKEVFSKLAEAWKAMSEAQKAEYAVKK